MHGDLVQLFNLAAVFTVQQPLATSSEMRAQENLPSLYFQFGISIVYFNLAIMHPWGDSHINRAGVLNRNFEKNHEEVPRVCFVDMVLILKRHIISCYLFPNQYPKRNHKSSCCGPFQAEHGHQKRGTFVYQSHIFKP